MMRRVAALAMAAFLVGCAGPPLTLYTLAPNGAPVAAYIDGPTAPQSVISVARVSIPDALDTQDIFVRDGATLRRSAASRWAERLSLGITDLITARLAAQIPQALVTDQPQAGPVTERLAINISVLDVTSTGSVTLVADWTWTPTDPRLPLRRARTLILQSADTGSDAGIAAAVRAAVSALAERLTGGGS